MKRILFISILALFATSSFAKIWVPRIFSDNMVLQAGANDKIWGTATPNSKVSISLDGKVFETTANERGDWTISTSEMKPSLESKELIISEDGKVQKTIKNVLVGEVWVLGGQSNMFFTVGESTDYEAAKSCANKNVRVFLQRTTLSQTPKKDTEPSSYWAVVTPKTVGKVSAVGYYFAEQLTKELNVPVGLIETPQGGSLMLSWLPAEKQSVLPHMKKYFEDFQKDLSKYDYKKIMAERAAKQKAFDEAHKGKKLTKAEEKERRNIYRPTLYPETPRRRGLTPCFLFNAKVAPIVGYTARGFAWYQGEEDSFHKPHNEHFLETFELLVETWRELWNNKDMPFYFFQLPSWEQRWPAKWVEARKAQYQASKKIKNSHMICTVDTGEADIHPRDKTPLGQRLFKTTMEHTYKNSDFDSFSPDAKSIKFDGNSAVITFDIGKSRNKLVSKGESRALEVRVDGKWIPAKGEIIAKNKIKVSSDSQFDAVRYAFKVWAMPDAWIFSSNGFPAVPFELYDVKK